MILTVSGSIDLLTATQLTEAVTGAVSEQPAGLIIDLTAIDFLATAGMSILLAARDAIAPQGRFAVVAAGATERPLRVGGLSEVIVICATVEDAWTALHTG